MYQLGLSKWRRTIIDKTGLSRATYSNHRMGIRANKLTRKQTMLLLNLMFQPSWENMYGFILLDLGSLITGSRQVYRVSLSILHQNLSHIFSHKPFASTFLLTFACISREVHTPKLKVTIIRLWD